MYLLMHILNNLYNIWRIIIILHDILYIYMYACVHVHYIFIKKKPN